MGWTTRNRHKSGSSPSLNIKVEIQNSDGLMDQQTDKVPQLIRRYFQKIFETIWSDKCLEYKGLLSINIKDVHPFLNE